MLFSRKIVNRRLERQELLDVRLRSQPRRAALRRTIVLALVVASLAGLTAYLAPRVQFQVERLTRENPAFTLDTLEVQTDGWITPELVRRWAGVKVGENLLALDAGRIKQRLELVPQVASASVDRVLPHLLRVRVAQRKLVAQVHVLTRQPGGGLTPVVQYLDQENVLVPPLPEPAQAQAMRQALGGLPVVTGLNPLTLRPGQTQETRPVQAALQLIMQFPRSPMEGLATLKSVDVAAPGALLVSTHQGGEVTLGLENLEQQLQRWRWVHEAGLRMGRVLASLDLSISNNCPVLWREPSPPQPPAPKSVKSPTNRRSHV